MTGLVNESEREDFNNSLKTLGYKLEDFELKENDQTISRGSTIVPISGEVTIKNKKTGKVKNYQAGHMSSWPATFDADLKQGYFN